MGEEGGEERGEGRTQAHTRELRTESIKSVHSGVCLGLFPVCFYND